MSLTLLSTIKKLPTLTDVKKFVYLDLLLKKAYHCFKFCISLLLGHSFHKERVFKSYFDKATKVYSSSHFKIAFLNQGGV